MNKDSNKYLKENIRIFGCFILGAVIMAALIFHFDSIFGFSDERYIVSFWRDFLYNSPKEYTISALVHGRDLSEYESRRVRGYTNMTYCIDDETIFLYDSKTDKYGIADKNGNWLLKPYYSSIDMQYTDKGIIVLDAGQIGYHEYGVFDLNYNELLPPISSEIEFYDDCIWVKNFGKYKFYCGVYDYSGNVIIDPIYEDVRVYNDFFVVEKNLNEADDYNSSQKKDHDTRFGIYDYEGNAVFEPIYKNIIVDREYESIIIQYNDEMFGIFDCKGNDLLADKFPQIDYMEKLDDWPILFIVGIHGQYGVINGCGDVVMDFVYYDIGTLKYDYDFK